MKIGEKIAMLRKERGITQRYIAERLSKSPQWLNHIEKDRRNISAAELYAVAQILEEDVNSFFAENINDTLSLHSPNRAR